MLLSTLLIGCESNQPSAELAAGEREIIELNLRLELLEYRLQSRSTADGSATLHEAGNHLDHLADARHTLETRIQSLRAEIEALGKDFEQSRVAMFEERRRAATGQSFEQMVTRHGRVFEDVTVTDVVDEGVSIRHRTGTATLRYKQLTDEQRAGFGMDEELSLLAEQRERSETLAWHQWVESQASIDDQRAPSPARVNPPVSVAAEIPSRRSSPLAEPARQFGPASGYRTYRPRYRSVYYYTPSRPCPQPRQAPIHPLNPYPHCGN